MTYREASGVSRQRGQGAIRVLIKPRMRGFICTTAHPVGSASLVRQAVDRLAGVRLPCAPGRVLVIGGSSGYGLATRLVTAFAGGAATIGVSYERPPTADRTASAGWYNNRSFEVLARARGLAAATLEGDAFSVEVKAQAADLIARDFGQIDLLVYSLAAPSRRDPRTGLTHYSSILPLRPCSDLKSLDVDTGAISLASLPVATQAQLDDTVAVMGGSDWSDWVQTLRARDLLSPECRTLHYTYVGSPPTAPIYADGTIGRAKADAALKARIMNDSLGEGFARLVALKAIVTQASSAIPLMPLYWSLLAPVMTQLGLHEGALEQILRLFEHVLPRGAVDDQGRLRLDDRELRDDVQAEVARRWSLVTTENLAQHADWPGFRAEQLRVFGFDAPGVDYAREVDPGWTLQTADPVMSV
jgi:enoyl-[acyl-carrier protein] reductase/trans-2-enoyl-CoA reductase (NAD+)